MLDLIFKRQRLLVVYLLFIFLAVGTSGYMLIEGWSLTDALYMTVITMTTIGFGEVKPLSPVGRLFTLGLITFGVIIATYSVSAVIELFTSEEFQGRIRNRRRRRQLAKINQHCIICGFGRMGRSLTQELRARGAPVIVIDQQSEVVERCDQSDIPAVLGNAADEQVLREAGIERAKSLVAAAKSDAENVFIVLTAKSIKPDLEVISRCNAEASIPKLEKAGANQVISPYAIAGRRIAEMLTHPNVTRFLDGILEFGDHQMRLEEFVVSHNSPLAGLSLMEARLKVAVLAVSHPDQEILSHPNGYTKLLPGASIIVMGVDEELNKLEKVITD